MSDIRVSGIRGIDLAVRDLSDSVEFYSRLWGLEEVSAGRGRVFLRATGREHHALALHQGPKIELLGVNFAAHDKAAVDALHAKAVGFGVDVLDAPHALSAVAGGGYGFSVNNPDGLRQTISCDVVRHDSLIGDGRRPNKFSHVVLRSTNVADMERFFCDLLGFMISDKTDGIDFLRCTADHHSVAIGKIAGPGLHHAAFELPDFDGLMGASGRLKMNGFPIEWGVGRHAGPGNNVFSFFVDPNGVALEYTTEMEQVDDATYPQRSAEDWKKMPIKPCSWGMAMTRSETLLRARTGKIMDELNLTCTEVISRVLAG
ncbi:MAG TPA: VOC family protein [Paraburkholderia sp.]|nr:VOC family protein [Paraburkholderia sp.]